MLAVWGSLRSKSEGYFTFQSRLPGCRIYLEHILYRRIFPDHSIPGFTIKALGRTGIWSELHGVKVCWGSTDANGKHTFCLLLTLWLCKSSYRPRIRNCVNVGDWGAVDHAQLGFLQGSLHWPPLRRISCIVPFLVHEQSDQTLKRWPHAHQLVKHSSKGTLGCAVHMSVLFFFQSAIPKVNQKRALLTVMVRTWTWPEPNRPVIRSGVWDKRPSISPRKGVLDTTNTRRRNDCACFVK